MFTRAHGPVMRALFDELLAKHPAGELHSALERAGRRLAAGRVGERASFAERLDAVRQAFQELGGEPAVEEGDRVVSVRLHHCPLGDVTAAHPETCGLAQALVSGIMGTPVDGHCAHGERPSCAFELPRPRDSGDS
jgi:predicted ArsR family transcriptional regulator